MLSDNDDQFCDCNSDACVLFEKSLWADTKKEN